MAIDGLHPASPRPSGMVAAGALAVRRHARRVGPLAAIALMHLALFHALQGGLPKQAMAQAPREVSVTFITPPTPPAPQSAPTPAPPKTVPVVKKRAAPPRPVAPVAPAVNPTPSPQAISTPAPEPAPVSPEASAATAAAPTASPSAPPAPAQPKTVTAGIEYLQAPQPDYPPIAKRMGEQGKAVVRVLVNDRGRPERVELQRSSGSARLDEAARQAVLRAVFKPFMEDGKAVPAWAVVPIRFQLD